jgi:oxygen-independent coproporphyrinogen-3 oxidase
VERHYVEQDVEEYIRAREYVVERLSQRDMLNEYVMTALRCAEGLDLAYIEGRFGGGATTNIVPVLQRWQTSGDVVFEGSRAYIPAERFLISDAVIESLFEV